MHFPVELPDHILALASQWSVRPEDMEEFHTRGRGHGGQKINKSTNCVELTHHPTGLTVRHQEHRGLLQNRIEAYALLIEKIAAYRNQEAHEQHEREYREAHPEGWARTKDGKEHMLHEKRHQAAKKDRRTEGDASPQDPAIGNERP
ncbi:peptide chain release factor-like protein [Candidatus Peribacteria bacterium]|nr:peptide chain release factor-like protein [Candidatus Peribacteria bacterium]MBM3302441.1 peptide chain release factor-like protein [Deltaproteobacteria bacterium]